MTPATTMPVVSLWVRRPPSKHWERITDGTAAQCTIALDLYRQRCQAKTLDSLITAMGTDPNVRKRRI